MNITTLQTFLTIIETGSLIKASQKLNVTQSTVTVRLKILEEEIGQVLLNRQKSGTILTTAGTKLLPYARIMIGLWRQAKFETGLPAGLESTCTLGCDRDLWHGPGRHFFFKLDANHSEIAISVRQGSARDLEEWLSAGSVDIILTFEAKLYGQQTLHTLPEEELILHSSVPNTGVKDNPNYIFVDHGAEYRKQHAEFYHDAGISRLHFDSSWWAMQYLLENVGSAYLPSALTQSYIAQGKLYTVAEAPVFKRKKCLIVNDIAASNWPWLPDMIKMLNCSES